MFFHEAKEAAESGQQWRILASAAPLAGIALGMLWQNRRLLAILEKQIHRDFEGTSELL